MRPFRFTLNAPAGSHQYHGVVFESGVAVACACDRPERGPWNVSQFQTVEMLEARLGVAVEFMDASEPEPKPPPCPLPEGNCGEPDVITGG